MANMHLVTGYAGAEHITAADQGSFNASLFGSGQYVLNRGNKFAASVVTNNQITVLDGDILMQGRHIRLDENSYVDITIENGVAGELRNDLIVARYTVNGETGVEDCNLVVIKGTPSATDPVDPVCTVGDIINDHATVNDMPLYRVPLNGLNVQELVPLFTVRDSAGGFSGFLSQAGAVNGYGSDVLDVDISDPYAAKNRPLCFTSGSANSPSGFSNGVRFVSFLSENRPFVVLIGFDQMNYGMGIWVNAMPGLDSDPDNWTWRGWTRLSMGSLTVLDEGSYGNTLPSYGFKGQVYYKKA